MAYKQPKNPVFITKEWRITPYTDLTENQDPNKNQKTNVAACMSKKDVLLSQLRQDFKRVFATNALTCEDILELITQLGWMPTINISALSHAELLDLDDSIPRFRAFFAVLSSMTTVDMEKKVNAMTIRERNDVMTVINSYGPMSCGVDHTILLYPSELVAAIVATLPRDIYLFIRGVEFLNQNINVTENLTELVYRSAYAITETNKKQYLRDIKAGRNLKNVFINIFRHLR